MGFTLTKKRFLIWKTIMTVVAGLVVGGAIKLFWPEHYFAWFPFIPLIYSVHPGVCPNLHDCKIQFRSYRIPLP